MFEKRIISFKPLVPSLLGVLFCFWSLQGNDLNFCNTAGCTLYHDTTIAGLSLWWYGTIAFCVLSLLAVLASVRLGRLIAGCILLCDTFLLILLSLTAPCVSCLLVGILFALSYRAFRNAQAKESGKIPRTSILLSIWCVFFVITFWAVLKSQLGTWSIYGEKEEAKIHLYFSPSCSHCRDAISFYAGNIDTAFFPVADTDTDIYKIRLLQEKLASGMTIDDAVAQCQNAKPWGFFDNFSLSLLMLRLHMLENKTHIFLAGSSGIPFLEYHGVPSFVQRELKKRRKYLEEQELDKEFQDDAETKTQETSHPQENDELPAELLHDINQCTRESCP